MSRTRPPCSPEFRGQLVALHRTGRIIEEIARDLEPSGQPIRNSVTDSVPARGTAPTSAAATRSAAEREALQRLRGDSVAVAWAAVILRRTYRAMLLEERARFTREVPATRVQTVRGGHDFLLMQADEIERRSRALFAAQGIESE